MVHRTAHVSHAQFYSPVAPAHKLHLCCVLSPNYSLSRAHVMFRIMLVPAPFSSTFSTPTSSSLLFPPSQSSPCATPQGLLFGRVAGHEPNAPVEASSPEVATTLLPSRKTSIVSTNNSGEDIATTPAVSEVDERTDLGKLASPLLTRDRDKCEPSQKFITLIDKVLRQLHHALVLARRNP